MKALALHAQVFRFNPVLGNLAIFQFSHEGGRSQAELVQPILGMHHQHMLAAHAVQHLGQRTAERLGEDANHLMLHTCRIRKRAK